MRRTGALLGALVLGTTLAGCWEQAGYNAGNTYFNDGETALTAGTIGNATELWSTDLGTEPATNLLQVNGKVFAEAETSISHKTFGLTSTTGNVLWTYNAPHDPAFPLNTSNPVYIDGVLNSDFAVGSFGGRQRINADTGAEISRTASPGNNFFAKTVAAVGGQVATTTRGNFPGGGGVVNVVNWQGCRAVFQDGNGGLASAFIGNDLLWSHTTQAVRFPVCASGNATPSWTTELGGTPVAIAVVGADKAVYVDDSGTMTLLDAVTGAVLWDTEVGADAGRPAVANGTIFLASADNRLAAYSAATGDELWNAALGARGGPPVVGGDVVYTVVGSDIVAFDADGCAAAPCPSLATLDFGGEATGSPIVDDGRVLVGTTDGRVVAFGLIA